MNPPLATGILVAAEAALFVLPLLPALEELRLKRDAEPLNVIQEHSGDVRYFAFGFRKYIDELIEPLQKCVETGTTVAGSLKNREEYVLLGQRCDDSFLVVAKAKDSNCRVLICAGTDLQLPDGVNFLKEVYAAKCLSGGERNTYRAILGEKEIHLRRGSSVMRWVHAVGRFQADHDSDMYGRVSSDEAVVLQTGCTFQRVHAPRIEMGYACETDGSPWQVESLKSSQIARAPLHRRLFDGDVEIRGSAAVEEHIISRGTLHIGAGVNVLGSVKSDKDLIVQTGACVAGSLISAGALHIGRKCRIHGPVLAERRIEIGSGTSCGTPDALTTVSSPIIDIEGGALFFGTVWAREQGRVLSKQ